MCMFSTYLKQITRSIYPEVSNTYDLEFEHKEVPVIHAKNLLSSNYLSCIISRLYYLLRSHSLLLPWFHHQYTSMLDGLCHQYRLRCHQLVRPYPQPSVDSNVGCSINCWIQCPVFFTCIFTAAIVLFLFFCIKGNITNPLSFHFSFWILQSAWWYGSNHTRV